MEALLPAINGMLVAGLIIMGASIWWWRRAALSWKEDAERLEAFIKDPRITPRDKEKDYRETFEHRLNALNEERRQIHVAINEVFDVLNEEAQETDDVRLMQCRNILLRAITISTYGREVPQEQGNGEA